MLVKENVIRFDVSGIKNITVLIIAIRKITILAIDQLVPANL